MVFGVRGTGQCNTPRVGAVVGVDDDVIAKSAQALEFVVPLEWALVRHEDMSGEGDRVCAAAAGPHEH